NPPNAWESGVPSAGSVRGIRHSGGRALWRCDGPHRWNPVPRRSVVAEWIKLEARPVVDEGLAVVHGFECHDQPRRRLDLWCNSPKAEQERRRTLGRQPMDSNPAPGTRGCPRSSRQRTRRHLGRRIPSTPHKRRLAERAPPLHLLSATTRLAWTSV